MALFEHTDRSLEELPDLRKQKRLSKLLGTDFLLNSIRKLQSHELGNFRAGALVLAMTFGGLGYYFYKQYYRQKMSTSNAYYRLINLPPLNAGQQFWWNDRKSESTDLMTWYYRIPKGEFDIKYRMRSAYIQGQFDHDKEILIPKSKKGVDGYDVITPFYYYRKLNPSSFLGLLQNGTPFSQNASERAGIAVYRGW